MCWPVVMKSPSPVTVNFRGVLGPVDILPVLKDADSSSPAYTWRSKLGFAVHWPAQPQALPRGHGMPCRDVPGRVRVRVKHESAGGAPEVGLALARLRVHVPACGAPLARIRGIDLLDAAGGLFFQPARQNAPARGEDLPVQPRLLPHVPAGLFAGASSGAGHVLHSQVLDADHVETPSQVGGQLLGPVLASVGLAGSQPRDRRFEPGAAVAAAFGTGELALEPSESPLAADGQAWTSEQFAGRQCRADRDPPIHAHLLPGARPRDGIRDRGERDVPAAGTIQLHPVRPGFRDGARPAEPHPPGLRHEYLPPVPVQPPDMVCPEGHDAEPLIPADFAPCGLAVRACEEADHCLGEIAQGLLLDNHAARRQPPVLVPRYRKLAALLRPVRRARPAGPPPRLLLHGKISYKSGVRAMVP